MATVINEKIAEIEKKYGELKETEFEELSIDELQQLRTEFANMQLEQTKEEQSMTR